MENGNTIHRFDVNEKEHGEESYIQRLMAEKILCIYLLRADSDLCSSSPSSGAAGEALA